ncbi:MAG: hypothetical protein AAF591_11160 [Verrucomicrobiota bacterium]
MGKDGHVVLILRILIGVLFVAALVVAARSGVEMAKKHLPTGAVAVLYPAGTRVSLDFPEEDPLMGSASAKVLRDYFFSVDAGTLTDEREKSDEVRSMAGEVELEYLDEDIDLVSVRVLSGDRAGWELWVHTRQLPKPAEGGGRQNGE